MTPTDPPTTSEYGRLPELVDVEGDSYVFVALLEDRRLDGPSNWLLQTFRVDPNDGDDDELVASVTERYRGDDPAESTRFEDQYIIAISAADAPRSSEIDSIRRALERWYVTCEACGRRYAARILRDEVVFLTPDGKGDCTNTVCVEEAPAVLSREETAAAPRTRPSAGPADRPH